MRRKSIAGIRIPNCRLARRICAPCYGVIEAFLDNRIYVSRSSIPLANLQQEPFSAWLSALVR
jgi:hypothetical protein